MTLEHAIALDSFWSFWCGEVFEENAVFIEPLFVGLGRVDAFFHFLVGHDASFVHVDEEHAAGLESAFLHDGERVEIGDDADFRGHDDEVVLGDIVAARAQTIAVEHGADLAAIGEGDRGRAVPWLHHAGVELVEGLLVLIHHRVTLPWFGDHHHHRVDQVIAAEVHELEGVVEARRVGSVLDDDREDARDVAFEQVALAECLASLHEVGVAHHRVDFTVVGDEAVRVGARPTWEGVGRETGVHQREGRLEIRVVEIGEILRELAGREHALVDHRAGREIGDIVVVTAGERVRLVAVHIAELVRHFVVADPCGDAFANHIEFAFEVDGAGDVRAFLDEDLLDERFVAAGGFAEDFAACGDRAPAEEFLAFLMDDMFEHLHGGFALAGFGGNENEARAVGAFGWKLDALFGHFLAQKFVGHLDENAGAVTGGRIRAAGTAVVHLRVHRERLDDDVVRALAFEVGDESDAAAILLL